MSNYIIEMPAGHTWNIFQAAYADLMKELGEHSTSSAERSDYWFVYKVANGMDHVDALITHKEPMK